MHVTFWQVLVAAGVVLSQVKSGASQATTVLLSLKPKSPGHDGESSADSGPGTCGLRDWLFFPYPIGSKLSKGC